MRSSGILATLLATLCRKRKEEMLQIELTQLMTMPEALLMPPSKAAAKGAVFQANWHPGKDGLNN